MQLNNATTTKMKKKVLSDCYSVERAGRSSCLFYLRDGLKCGTKFKPTKPFEQGQLHLLGL